MGQNRWFTKPEQLKSIASRVFRTFTTSMGYAVAIVLFLCGAYLFGKVAAKFGADRKIVLAGWALKLLCSALFVWFYSLSGFDGSTIQGDAYNFYYDSGVLADYAQKDFSGYLHVLFGMHPDPAQLASTDLANTNIWSYGDNGDLINDNRLMIRLNSLIHFFSFGNLYVHILIFSGLAYAGLLLLYRAFSPYVERKRYFLILLVAFPSLVFWTSGLTKETLSIFSIGIFLYSLMQLLFVRRSVGLILLLIIAILMLLFNKPYVGLVVIPMSSVLVFGKLFGWRRIVLPLFAVSVIVGFSALSFAPERINPVTKLSNRQTDMMNLGRGGVFFVTDSSFCSFSYDQFHHFDTLPDNKIKVLESSAGEYKLFGPHPFLPFTMPASEQLYERYLVQKPSRTFVEITPINNSGIQLVKNIPESIYNSTLRTFYAEGTGIYSSMIFITNVLLLFVLGYSIFKRRKLSLTQQYLLFFLLFTAVSLLLVTGWTTPVIGAVIRYKVPAELLILIAAALLIRQKKKIQS